MAPCPGPLIVFTRDVRHCEAARGATRKIVDLFTQFPLFPRHAAPYLLLARTHREACLQTAHGNAVTVQPSHSVNVLIHPRLGHRVVVDVVSRRNGLSALQEGIDDVPDLGLVAQRVPALERLELFC